MLVVVVSFVVVVVLLVAELCVDVFVAAVEFVSMEMLASIIVELLSSAPNVKREAAKKKIKQLLRFDTVPMKEKNRNNIKSLHEYNIR